VLGQAAGRAVLRFERGVVLVREALCFEPGVVLVLVWGGQGQDVRQVLCWVLCVGQERWAQELGAADPSTHPCVHVCVCVCVCVCPGCCSVLHSHGLVAVALGQLHCLLQTMPAVLSAISLSCLS